MPELAVAGFVLALVLTVAALWMRWRAMAETRRRGERVERKIDALLHYLALDSEREAIEVEVARDEPRR